MSFIELILMSGNERLMIGLWQVMSFIELDERQLFVESDPRHIPKDGKARRPLKLFYGRPSPLPMSAMRPLSDNERWQARRITTHECIRLRGWLSD